MYICVQKRRKNKIKTKLKPTGADPAERMGIFFFFFHYALLQFDWKFLCCSLFVSPEPLLSSIAHYLFYFSLSFYFSSL